MIWCKVCEGKATTGFVIFQLRWCWPPPGKGKWRSKGYWHQYPKAEVWADPPKTPLRGEVKAKLSSKVPHPRVCEKNFKWNCRWTPLRAMQDRKLSRVKTWPVVWCEVCETVQWSGAKCVRISSGLVRSMRTKEVETLQSFSTQPYVVQDFSVKIHLLI